MNRCTAKTAKGKWCKARPLEGSELCVAHTGANGRKTALTPEVADRIIQMLRAGNYVDVACAAAGVARATFYGWLERTDEPYREFRERVDQARAEDEARDVALIAKAATKDWKAAAWRLERKYPDRWGRPSLRQETSNASNEGAKPAADPFSEVDELAEKRRTRSA